MGGLYAKMILTSNMWTLDDQDTRATSIRKRKLVNPVTLRTVTQQETNELNRRWRRWVDIDTFYVE
eukprot:11450783-Heterocapsa_arctica.AAC.1